MQGNVLPVGDCQEMTCFSFLPHPVILELVMDGDLEEIALSKIGERYGALRIVNPRADEARVRSMKRYGQLSPVVCVRMDGYELIDGFKRWRACRHIGKETLQARILTATERVVKAALLQLNRGRSISELEEALVFSSLHREDGLTQREIALLLGRHKSWVSRRISLVERLSEEVREDRWEHPCILATPWEFVGPRQHKPEGFAGRLVLLERISTAIAKEVKRIAPQEATRFSGLLKACLVSAEDVVAALKEVRI